MAGSGMDDQRAWRQFVEGLGEAGVGGITEATLTASTTTLPAKAFFRSERLEALRFPDQTLLSVRTATF